MTWGIESFPDKFSNFQTLILWLQNALFLNKPINPDIEELKTDDFLE